MAPTTTAPASTTTVVTVDDCAEAADQAVAPLQEFIDEYQDLTPEEWNALDPPPDAQQAQDQLLEIAQAAVDRGCDATAMEQLLADRIAALDGQGEVGRAIAAALRGDGPILGPPMPAAPPTTIGREELPTTRNVQPGDDLDTLLQIVAPGSTIRFAAGTYEFADPIVVGVDVTFAGAGIDETVIRSTAEGVAVTFVGPGGFAVEDMTIEHVGHKEASVLLAIEGPVRVSRTELRGAASGGQDTQGGGHGLVFAFENLPGFPERTDAERAGDLIVEESRIDGNEAAGILLTGTAQPTVVGTEITGNGGCGICYTGSSGGLLRDTTVSGNSIGVQIGDAASPALDDATIVDNQSAGISIDGTGATTIAGSDIERNSGVGVQLTGTGSLAISETAVRTQGVGVLVAGDANAEITDSEFVGHDMGVQVGGAAVVDASGNTFTQHATAAISYGDTSSGSAAGNTITKAVDVAIQAIGDATPDITDNDISTTGSVGVSVVERADAVVENNTIRDRDVAVQVGGSADATVRGNDLLDFTAVGVLYGETATGTVSDNDITGADAVGFVAGGDSSPSLVGNRIVGNGVGVVFREQAAGEARANIVKTHTIAVQIVDSADPLLLSNDIEDSTEAGVAVGGSATPRIEQNRFLRNGNISIQIAENSRPVVAGNVINGEAVYGAIYRDAAGGEFRDNRIVNHVYGIQLEGTAAPSITGNSMEKVALTSIAYTETSGGDASGNTCTESFSAGISVSDQATPTLGTNDCTVSAANG